MCLQTFKSEVQLLGSVALCYCEFSDPQVSVAVSVALSLTSCVTHEAL